MSRFTGTLLGAALMGITLERALALADTVHAAYRISYLVAAARGLFGIVPALRFHGRSAARKGA